MADKENLEINISRIATGMRRMNEMKSEIRSMIELLTLYLSDMTHAQLENRPKNHWEHFVDIVSVANRTRGSELSLRALITEDGIGSTMDFQLRYLNPHGKYTLLLSGSRGVYAGETRVSPMPQQLSKWDVADCYHLIEELTKRVAERHLDEIQAELDLYLSLIR